MEWSLVKLGDVCVIEKGKVGIQKAIPGKFPMVVTGEERKSHNEFHFDDEAVIVPLVSGTGHGHASIKRIHYQSGKFALGNILCAIIPKDKRLLNAEYLFRFLELNKENELVSRMKGMANVTLSIKEISKIEIPLPSINSQIEFINNYRDLKEKNNLLFNELNHQLVLIKQLRQAFLKEAMQGTLMKSKSINEVGHELLEKIKVEKAKLIKDKKIKKEKELSPVTEDEIPFEIPENWIWCRLGDVCKQVTDGDHLTPPKKNQGRMLLSAKNIREGFISYENIDFISEEDYQKSIARCNPERNDILIVSVGGTIGRSTIKFDDKEFAIVRSVALIKPFIGEMAKYLKFVLDSPILQKEINGRSWGTAQPCLYLNQIKELIIPLPPLDDQRLIIEKLEQLMKYCDELEEGVKNGQEYNLNLLQQVLREALQPKEVIENFDALFDNNDYYMHIAMLHKLIKDELGINYGEVATQKTVFHLNTFTSEKIPYPFINSNYGTYSHKLKDDLQKNKFLAKAKVNGREVFKVESSKEKEVLNSLTKPENKSFVEAVKEVLAIYRLPFINKETDKIELLNTVSKLILDLKSVDADVIYQGMKSWKIKQADFKCKADKFSLRDTKDMIKLIHSTGLDSKLIA